MVGRHALHELSCATPERYKLLHGPYLPPRCRVGRRLTCAVRGRRKVCGMSDGRIPWPVTRHKRGRPFLIVCGGLAEAVRRESEIAVAYGWGVTAQTVWQWRKARGHVRKRAEVKNAAPRRVKAGAAG